MNPPPDENGVLSPLLSIVICTYNNSESLAITIQQILSQKISNPERVELVVINNNSSDNTNQVLENIQNTNFPFRHYFESRQGISHARNTGFENSLGAYILYTDDDAEIPQYWLERYINRILVSNPDCIFGKITVIWDMPSPWWYEDEKYQSFFAAIDYGDEEFQISDKRYPFLSKNACIRKNCLIEIGGFDPTLGRKGALLAGGEETLVFYRLVEAEKTIYYCPELTIRHRLKPREYKEENITNQYMACAKPILRIATLQPGKRFLNKPLGVLENQIKEIIYSLPMLLTAYITGNKKEFFYQSLRFRRAFLITLLWFGNF
ncbi:glycosyltransferase family 2 protein [Cellvibrio sp. OA-2007]|uniref:glycosyltransferase family 2 protein n=1 Tax=Cellvibrio sp. OA-2007 TaxID=529823 RepID=UPI0007863C60|nr:glycosyltransferase family 2 protein [Cellvibrio sp. OA-2007]